MPRTMTAADVDARERREHFARLGLRTAADVDARIDYYQRKAVAAEERCDREEWESAEYWRHHDNAVAWHERARKLMPWGS